MGLPTETWSLESYTIEEYEALLASIKDGTVTIDSSVLEADAIVNAGLENVEIIYELIAETDGRVAESNFCGTPFFANKSREKTAT